MRGLWENVPSVSRIFLIPREQQGRQGVGFSVLRVFYRVLDFALRFEIKSSTKVFLLSFHTSSPPLNPRVNLGFWMGNHQTFHICNIKFNILSFSCGLLKHSRSILVLKWSQNNFFFFTQFHCSLLELVQCAY